MKTARLLILFLFALLLWKLFDQSGNAWLHIDGADIDGPAGALAALLLAGGGLLFAALAMLAVALLLALVFAGVGLLALTALTLAALIVAAVVSPLLIALLLPLALVYWLVRRARLQRLKAA